MTNRVRSLKPLYKTLPLRVIEYREIESSLEPRCDAIGPLGNAVKRAVRDDPPGKPAAVFPLAVKLLCSVKLNAPVRGDRGVIHLDLVRLSECL